MRWLVCSCAILVGCASSPASSSVDAPASSPTDVRAPTEFVTEPLCDGSSTLRLQVFVEAQFGREQRGSAVRVENGHLLFSVDGLCSYWMSAGWISESDNLSRDRGFRSGKLPDETRRILEEILPLSGLGTLNDCVVMPGLFDASVRTYRSARSVARCGTSGERFDTAWRALQSLTRELWPRATPLEGEIRVSAVETSAEFSVREPFQWPIQEPVATFILDDANMNEFAPGVSKLVSDLGTAALLRRLRDQYIEERAATPGLFSNWDGLKVTDGVQTAFVYMRDVLPYEDKRGLLPFSTFR